MIIDCLCYCCIVVLIGVGILVGLGLCIYCGLDGVWEEYEVECYGYVSVFVEWLMEMWCLFGGMCVLVFVVVLNVVYCVLVDWEVMLML